MRRRLAEWQLALTVRAAHANLLALGQERALLDDAIVRRQRIRDTVVFFGSARIHEDSPLGKYYTEARTLAAMVTPGPPVRIVAPLPVNAIR